MCRYIPTCTPSSTTRSGGSRKKAVARTPEERLSIQPSDTTCSNVRVQYGFMEDPNVPEALEQACEQVGTCGICAVAGDVPAGCATVH